MIEKQPKEQTFNIELNRRQLLKALKRGGLTITAKYDKTSEEGGWLTVDAVFGHVDTKEQE